MVVILAIQLLPIQVQVKEALFSSLASMDLFDGSEVRVLDIFSGSGSIGLEALSRGGFCQYSFPTIILVFCFTHDHKLFIVLMLHN